MRLLALAMLAIGIVATGEARAQTYDPAFPVCLHLIPIGGGSYEDCRYYTMEQCHMSASGRAGYCVLNPFYAGTARFSERRRYRRGY
jgi:uncharacterized protein DUF3551